jgi:hypothetical protein
MSEREETTMDEVRDPQGLLTAYNNLKEEIKRISAERDSLTKEKEALEAASKDNAWRNRALLAEVKASLTNKGLKDADRLLKVLGTDGIDFDDEGNITGLDERVKEATKDFPELFDPKVRAAGKANAHASETVETKRDPIREAVSSALTGRN